MKIIIERPKNSAENLMRSAGYTFLRHDYDKGDMSFAKRIYGADYPRFHAYVKEEQGTVLVNLHLDQKKASYEGSHAHSGEYDGEVVEQEGARLRSLCGN